MKTAFAAGFVACLMARSMVAIPMPGGAATDGAGGETRDASAAGARRPVARSHAYADLPPRSRSGIAPELPPEGSEASGISHTLSTVPGVRFHGTRYAGNKRAVPARGTLTWADDGTLMLVDVDGGTNWFLQVPQSSPRANIQGITRRDSHPDANSQHTTHRDSQATGPNRRTIWETLRGLWQRVSSCCQGLGFYLAERGSPSRRSDPTREGHAYQPVFHYLNPGGDERSSSFAWLSNGVSGTAEVGGRPGSPESIPYVQPPSLHRAEPVFAGGDIESSLQSDSSLESSEAMSHSAKGYQPDYSSIETDIGATRRPPTPWAPHVKLLSSSPGARHLDEQPVRRDYAAIVREHLRRPRVPVTPVN